MGSTSGGGVGRASFSNNYVVSCWISSINSGVYWLPNVASNRAFITLFASTGCVALGLCEDDAALLGCGCGWVEAGGGCMVGGRAPSPMGLPFPVPFPCEVGYLGCAGFQLDDCEVDAVGRLGCGAVVDPGCSTKFL